MKILCLFLLINTFSLAETYQYEVSGMHCGACKKAIRSTVCAIPGVKTCDISIGSMTLSSEDGKSIDQVAVKKAVQEAAERFKSEYAISSAKKKD